MKKRILALFLLVVLAFSLVACGGDPVDTNTGSDSSLPASSNNSDVSSNTDNSDSGDEVNKGYDETMEHKIIISDREAHKILVMDLNACNGDFEALPDSDSAIVWEYDLANDPNRKTRDAGAGLDSAKYRYSPYYGKDVVIACSSDGWAGVVDYEAKTLLWESDAPVLHNAHSIEMLPNGDVVGAVAKDTDDAGLVYFPLSAGVNTYSSAIPSKYSHGVCWDPENEWLWVLENTETVAIKVNGMGTEDAKLVRLSGLGAQSQGGGGGHAFAPVGGQPGKYWASFGGKVYQFDSVEEEMIPDAYFSSRDTKGICSFSDGTVVQIVADEDTVVSSDIHIVIRKLSGGKKQELRNVETVVNFPGMVFYKVQAFTKDYQ